METPAQAGCAHSGRWTLETLAAFVGGTVRHGLRSGWTRTLSPIAQPSPPLLATSAAASLSWRVDCRRNRLDCCVPLEDNILVLMQLRWPSHFQKVCMASIHHSKGGSVQAYLYGRARQWTSNLAEASRCLVGEG